VGSTKVSLSELSQAADGPGLADRVQVPRSDGSAPMELDLEVVVRDAAMAATKPPRKPVRQQEAVKAKSYLDGHGVGSILHEMVHEMLRDMPDDPLAFMGLYLQDRNSNTPAAQPSNGHSRAQLEQQVDQLKRELQEQTEKLRAATAAGGASPAVGSSNAGADAAKARKDELRKLTQQSLIAGLEDGRLDGALSAKTGALSARGELRKEAADGLIKASVDGSLEAALKQVGDVEGLRQKASTAMGEACESGRMDEAVARRDELRKATSSSLVGLDSGGLENAVASVAGRQIADTFTDLPGLGNDEWEGFPADVCPAELPDMVKHHSIMATVLKKDKAVYTALKDSKTPGGVPLARCIKTGIDNLGHPMIKSVGAIAGDAECYDTFRTLFDPILSKWHGPAAESDTHPTDMDIRKISVAPLESAASDGERYVMSCQIRARRNLRGIAMPPAAQREGRREVERVLVKGLARLPDELQGEYHPLRGSTSYAPRPGGMTVEGQARLEAQGLLFSFPDAPMLLASGTGRHWPDARGIFATGNGQLAAWLNDEDHLQLIAGCDKGDLRGAFARFRAADEALSSALKEDGHEFAYSSRLGYLSSCPSNVGTALLAEVVVKLPLLSAKFSKSDFRSLCKRLKLRSRAAGGSSELGTWEIANEERLGSSEVDQVNGVLEGVRALVAAEQKLARGEGEELKLADILPAAVRVPSKG